MWLREPNWVEAPNWKLKATSQNIQYPGTAQELYDKFLPIPKRRTMRFDNWTKVEEYEITNFFYARNGRHTNFWQPAWDTAMKLYEDISNGASSIKIYPCNFHLAYSGYERILLVLATGDMITREVTAVTYNASYETLTLNTVMSQDIAIADVSIITLFMLGRLDMDALKLEHQTDIISSVIWDFIELPREYPA
jgi:hypothetical protein